MNANARPLSPELDEATARRRTFQTLVVDANPIMRVGLCATLAAMPELKVVAQASGGHSALMANRQHKPDLALLDMAMEDTDIEDAVKSLKGQAPNLKILIGYTQLTAAEAARLLHGGANGLIARTANIDELTQAVRTVLQGGTYLPAGVASQIFRESSPSAMLPLSGLSPRELEVLRLIAAGYSNKDIARRLSLSVRTVETHRFNLRHKSGMSRPKDLTQLARKLGLTAPAQITSSGAAA